MFGIYGLLYIECSPDYSRCKMSAHTGTLSSRYQKSINVDLPVEFWPNPDNGMVFCRTKVLLFLVHE